MTISTVYSVDLYSGDNSTTSFAITFDFENTAGNVSVSLKNTSTGVVTAQTGGGTDYTVSGSNVVFNTAPTATEEVIIELLPDFLQSTDLTENEDFPQDAVEDELDQLKLEVQALKEQISRCIKLDPSAANGIDTTILATSLSAENVITVNSGGTGFDMDAVSGSGTGEVNTASNAGAGGVGVFKAKSAKDLQFKNINSDAATITVTDDTVNDEINLEVADNVSLPGTESVAIPGGTTGQRPGSPAAGMLRKNTTTASIEYYDGSSWVDLSGLALVSDTTPQLGGNLDVNSFKITSASNGDIDIEPNGTGNVLIGNLTFDADQTVGAGQDNYVLTYDNGTGLVSLEAAAGGGLADVVDDTTPQLGGMLDVNGNAIGDGTRELLTFVEDASAVNHVEIENAATGNGPVVRAKGDDTNVPLVLEAKGSGGGIQMTRSTSSDGWEFVGSSLRYISSPSTYFNHNGSTSIRVYCNGSEVVHFGTSGLELGNNGVFAASILDEDTMSSDSATSLATQQSIKAYVDSNAGIASVVADTTPQLGGQLDVNGNAIGDGTRELLTFTEDASAVNHVNIENEATGSGPIISAAGDDANIDLNIDTKGTGALNLGSADSTIVLTGTSISGTAIKDEDNMASDSATHLATQQSIKAYADTKLASLLGDTTPQLGGMLDVNGQALGDGTRELLTFTEDASAVNHVNIENEATGSGPIISAVGDDTNVDLNISAKGTGNITVGNFTFDADQTVGVGEDNYVLTYDNASGLITLEAASGGASAASQAEQETGTATNVYVSPGRQQYHGSACKVWAEAATDFSALDASYNMTSITDTAAGLCSFTIATDMSSVAYCVVLGLQSVTTDNNNLKVEGALTAGAINSVANRNDAGTLTDPTTGGISIACFGDQ